MLCLRVFVQVIFASFLPVAPLQTSRSEVVIFLNPLKMGKVNNFSTVQFPLPSLSAPIQLYVSYRSPKYWGINEPVLLLYKTLSLLKSDKISLMCPFLLRS